MRIITCKNKGCTNKISNKRIGNIDLDNEYCSTECMVEGERIR